MPKNLRVGAGGTRVPPMYTFGCTAVWTIYGEKKVVWHFSGAILNLCAFAQCEMMTKVFVRRVAMSEGEAPRTEIEKPSA